MAGEVQGAIYEAIVRVATELAIKGNRRGWRVLAHEQPSWISIEPDIAIGRDKESIDVLLLVTHTSSESMSHKKFWRNAAELFQWKVQGPAPVRVVDVVFVSKFKPELKKISAAIMDAVLEVGGKSYGKILVKYATRNAAKFGTSDEVRYESAKAFCERANDEYDATFAAAVVALSEDLKSVIAKDNVSIAPLWALERENDGVKRPYPKARPTAVRNGIAKLMLLDSVVRSHAYDNVVRGSDIPFNVVPDYARTLGLIIEDVDGARVDDKDVRAVITNLGKDRCEAVLARLPARMQQYIATVRAEENNRLACEYVVQAYDRLSTVKGMTDALVSCYRDPLVVLSAAGTVTKPPVDHWLFVFCMTIDKARARRVVAYGLSNLAEETGLPEIGSLGGVLISPFINLEKPLRPDILKAVASVFAGKIRELGVQGLSDKAFQTAMCEMLRQRQMYTLSVYRFFDPIGDLVKIALEKCNIAWKEAMVPTCLREFADAKAAKTKYLSVGPESLVFSQSCHGSHVNDKTKELSGRFRATKVMWDGKRFINRPEARSIYFVADGDWRSEDFEMLSRSGASQIYYPADVDQLVERLQTRRR